MSKQAKIDVTINGEQAKARLDEIKEDLRQIKALRDKAAAEGDVKGYAQMNAEMKKLTSEARKLEKANTDISKVLGDLSGSSIKDLNAAYQQLNREMREMKRNDPAFAQKSRDVKALKNELDKASVSYKQNLSGSSSFFSSIGGYVTMALGAVYSLGAGIKSAIDSWREEEKALKKVEQAIKSTGGAAGLSMKELTAEASKLQSETIIGDETILNDVTAQLLTFTNIAGENFKRAQESAMNLATVLDGDLKGSSIMLGKALNDPIQGLTAMRRVGIAFSDSQRETIKSLVETNQIAEAQTVILNELERQYGGQAKAAAAGAGALDQAANKFSDFGETVGRVITTSITPFVRSIGDVADWLNSKLSESIKSATEKFDEQVESVFNLQNNILPLLGRYDELANKSDLNQAEQSELNSIIKTVSETIPSAITQFDEYGNAISISTDRVREFIAAEKDRLMVVNREAIEENQRKLKQIEKDIEQSQYRINQIQASGTFKITESLKGTVTPVVINREASDKEVREEQEKYRKLLAEKNGYNAELERLNGDALQKEAERREEERKAAEKLEQQRLEYRKKSTAELKKLAGEGDKLAEEILSSRVVTDAGVAKTAYEKLSEAIAQAKKNLEALARSGDFAAAQVAGVALRQLEGQKLVVDGIVKAGGNVEQFLFDLTDSTAAELEEQNEAWTEFYKGLEPEAKKYYDNLAQLEKEKVDSQIAVINEEQKRRQQEYDDKKKQEEDWQEWLKKGQYELYIDIAAKVAAAKFQMIRQENERELDERLNALDKQRDAELANVKLTEDQKNAIRDKYDKKEKQILRESWEKQHKADVAQAWINMALSVGKAAINTWPLPAIPLMAMAAVEGGAQIAMVTKQKNPYKKGGYTNESYSDDTPAGEVHANEFVANADAVRNPSVRAVLDIMDYAQRAGTIRSINLPALVAAQNKPLKSGGFTSETGHQASNPDLQYQPAVNDKYINAMERLAEIVDNLQQNGIEAHAKLVYQDYKKMKDKEESAMSDTN